MIYIGNHVSSSKGYEAMGKQEVALGGDTFAFFHKKSKRRKRKRDKRRRRTASSDTDERSLIWSSCCTCTIYNECLCSKGGYSQIFCGDAKDDIRRMEYLPGAFYNFHRVHMLDQGSEAGIELIAAALNECISSTQSVTILLETMAGKGSEVGRSFEELKEIMDRVSCKEKIGVCFDTCHVWDGGYDIVNHLDEVLLEFDRLIGLDKLCAVHLNDSMNDCGAHKDRHQKLGLGKIGEEALRRVVTHQRFRVVHLFLRHLTRMTVMQERLPWCVSGRSNKLKNSGRKA